MKYGAYIVHSHNCVKKGHKDTARMTFEIPCMNLCLTFFAFTSKCDTEHSTLCIRRLANVCIENFHVFNVMWIVEALKTMINILIVMHRIIKFSLHVITKNVLTMKIFQCIVV